MWVHESSRVFHDRLINEADKVWWWSCVQQTMRKCFEADFSEAYKTILFGTWADKKCSDYKEIKDARMLQDMLREYQLDFNATKMKEVDLVLFDDAIAHSLCICRVLRQPRGNALLMVLVVGGSGRHSLCELAAHISSMECRSIVIVRNYGRNEFHDDHSQAANGLRRQRQRNCVPSSPTRRSYTISSWKISTTFSTLVRSRG